MIKHLIEADEAGLELLGPGSSVNYKRYRFIGCSHEAELQPTHVRRKHVACKECLELKYSEYATAKNVRILEKTESAGIRLCKLSCGHIQSVRVSHLMSKSEIICSECHEIKLMNQASEQNLTYFGKSQKKGVFRRYQFNDCLHEKDINFNCVLKGNFECKICIDNKHVTDANNESLVYIESISGNYGLYMLPCGCKKKIRKDHVRDSRWSCDNCSDNHYTKPSKLYLLKITDGNLTWLKLGYAKNLKNRISIYGLSKSATVSIVLTVDIPSGRIALAEEKKIHSKFSKYRLDKEFMKNYHKNNGFTECYNLEILDEIISTMKELQNE